MENRLSITKILEAVMQWHGVPKTNLSNRDLTFGNTLWRKARIKLFEFFLKGLVNTSHNDWIVKLIQTEFIFKIDFLEEYKVLPKLRTIPSKGGGIDFKLEGGCEGYIGIGLCMEGDLVLSTECKFNWIIDGFK